MDWIDAELEDLESRKLFRHLRPVAGGAGPYTEIAGNELLNLASNNYLDLARHPKVVAAVKDAVDEWGWGSGASALVSGWSEQHEELCRRIATLEATEDAVIFPTGFQANVGTVGALCGKGGRVIMDKLCHASIVDGARLSEAEVRVYPHCDTDKLEKLLEKKHPGHTLVVTDSVFSMDGDCAPLSKICELCEYHNVMLMVDEAHATGVLGEHGSGALEMLSIKDKVPVKMGTLSKALGGMGGFVAGSKKLCDLLRNKARSMIYTTAAPVAVVSAAIAAIEVIAEEPWRRKKAIENANIMRAALKENGIDTIDGPAAIVPIIVGDEKDALSMARGLFTEGILAPAIRPPTVPKGTSRLRLSLTAAHTESDMENAISAILEEWKKLDH